MAKAPATTEKKQIASRFKPGQSGNPAGRPKGSRNKLCEQFIHDLQTVWAEGVALDPDNPKDQTQRGLVALRKISIERPAAFVGAVAQLVPKEFDLGDKTQAGFKELWTALATGKLPKVETEGDEA